MENVNNLEKSADSVETTAKKEYRALPKKVIMQCLFRQHVLNQLSFGYDRGYVNSWTSGMLPALKYLYKDNPEELKQALYRTRDYWLCEQTFASIAIGIYLSMEEQYANGADFDPKSIREIKSSLMGPLSGMGDSIMGSTIRQLILVFFLGYAMEGVVWAGLGFVIVYSLLINTPLIIMFCNSGYKYGKEAVSKLLGTPWLKAITGACTMASMMIMGGMAAKYTTFKLSFSWNVGETVYYLQDKLDAAIPGMLALIAVFTYYFLVGKKVNFLILILGTLAVCIILVLCGLV